VLAPIIKGQTTGIFSGYGLPHQSLVTKICIQALRTNQIHGFRPSPPQIIFRLLIFGKL